MKFVPAVAAVPTLGGILADLPLSSADAARIPEPVRLPVTERAAETHEFVVVDLAGRGVAMHPSEAAVLNLTEAPNWIPDPGNAPCVPDLGDLDHIEPRDPEEAFISRIEATTSLPWQEYAEYEAWLRAIGAPVPEHEEGGIDWLEYMAQHPDDQVAEALYSAWIRH